jgi:hypothetical protein
VSGGEAAFEPPGEGSDEAEIDVVPEHRGILLGWKLGTGKAARVGVALHHFESGLQGGGMKQSGKLAKAAAEIRDEAPGAEFTARRESAATRGAPELFPETEDPAGWDFQAMKPLTGCTEVLNLSGGEGKLGIRDLSPERSLGFRDRRRGNERFSDRMNGDRLSPLLPPAAGDEDAGFQIEDQGFAATGFVVLNFEGVVHGAT